ncbi:hypothetical protein ACHAPU_002294 [Fusarium lateritium]
MGSKSANLVLTAEALNKALPSFHFSTQAVHADDFVSPHRAIAPAMHSAVNYRYARDPDNLVEMENDDYLTMAKLDGLKKLSLDCLDQAGPGDMIHIETPVNPTGEALDISFFKRKAMESGALLTVDATLAPPPLQDPIQLGADLVMHSGTKYIGGHSDMLCGIVIINPERVKDGLEKTLRAERMVLGNVMGSMEGWLGIRSVRTLHLRVMRQSQTAQGLVTWLNSGIQDPASPTGRVVSKVAHSSVQQDALGDGWLQKQMPNGHSPVFSVWLKRATHAKRLPSKLYIFQHATSLGGVESLCEWRAMSSRGEDQTMLRISTGVEDLEDLKGDLTQAFQALLADFP